MPPSTPLAPHPSTPEAAPSAPSPSTAADTATAAAGSPLDRRRARAAAFRQTLLHGPILPTLLRLAFPNIVLMVVQAAISGLETWYVSALGTEALAGVALVFPVLMLMQMMSAGSVGGGVSAAIARALGGGREEAAQSLVLHALIIALGFGALFTLAVVGGGRLLYSALGGVGGALEAAVVYSGVVFLGAIPLWLSNILANVLRGMGNMRVPAVVSVTGAVLPIALSPLLIHGAGPLPGLGVLGAGLGMLSYYLFSATVLWIYLAAGRAPLNLGLRGGRLSGAHFWEILRVGLPSSLGAVTANLTVISATGYVAGFGTAALAGYGIGARLEYMQIPLVFGLGAALVAMVGTNMGAGQVVRARRIAWSGATLAAAVTLCIGGGTALYPLGWAGLFSSDAEVLAAASAYLRWVGPSFGFLGLGMALYFSSQGVGRMLVPASIGVLRLGVVLLGGWLLVHGLGLGLHSIFATISLAMALFGGGIALAVWGGIWRGAEDR